MSRNWSYKVREVNKSISLLADNRSFGTLYGSDKNSQANARLIAAAPEMYRVLKAFAECRHEDGMFGLMEDAQELIARIDGEAEHE